MQPMKSEGENNFLASFLIGALSVFAVGFLLHSFFGPQARKTAQQIDEEERMKDIRALRGDFEAAMGRMGA